MKEEDGFRSLASGGEAPFNFGEPDSSIAARRLAVLRCSAICFSCSCCCAAAVDVKRGTTLTAALIKAL